MWTIVDGSNGKQKPILHLW